MSFNCSSELFGAESFNKPQADFTPYDKIYVMIQCRDLAVGEYTMDANWVHEKHGIVRTDSHQFSVADKDDKRIYFWFRLSRKGPLKSAITNQDFNEEYFGKWNVDGFMNDEPVSSNAFIITY